MIAFLRRGYARSGQIHMLLWRYSGVKSGEKLHPGSFFEPRGVLQKLNQRGLGHCNRSPKPPRNQKKSHWVYPQQMAKIGVFRIPNFKIPWYQGIMICIQSNHTGASPTASTPRNHQVSWKKTQNWPNGGQSKILPGGFGSSSSLSCSRGSTSSDELWWTCTSFPSYQYPAYQTLNHSKRTNIDRVAPNNTLTTKYSTK